MERQNCALLKAENRKYEYLTDYIPVPEGKPITLKLELNQIQVTFYYQVEEEEKSSRLWRMLVSYWMKPAKKAGLPEVCVAYAVRI